MSPLFSIIIPQHDTPQLLRRCLASIPRRDDTEVIVVDDHSPIPLDELRRIAREAYAGTAIHIIKLPEKAGAGHARNVGLGKASGEWLIFADADDLYTPAMDTAMTRCRALSEASQPQGNSDNHQGHTPTPPPDIYVMNALALDEQGHTMPTLLTRRMAKYAARSSRLRLMALLYGVWTPWSRMVRRSLVEEASIRFDETPVGNDAMFMLTATAHARHVEVDPTVCYLYYQPHSGSQTRALSHRPETRLLGLSLRLRINQLYRSVGYPFLWPLHTLTRPLLRTPSTSREARRLLHAYRHTPLTELRTRLMQLLGRLTGIL